MASADLVTLYYNFEHFNNNISIIFISIFFHVTITMLKYYN
jgi:hypothetical protein